MLATVIQIDAYDPVADAAVTLRAASHDDPAACHLDGETWWPAIAKLPTLRYDLFDGSFGGQITAPSSSVTLQTEPWPDFGRYALADARLRLWTGNLGDAWADFTLRFDGRIQSQPQVQDFQAQIDFAVDDRWLDTALLDTYAGTTGAEGPVGITGQPKPLALGAPRYVAGTLVDSVNSIFQVSAYGAIEGFEVALEKLARFGDPIADVATYAELAAATIPAGTWATAKALGMARLGAPPNGQIDFLIEGDAAGPDGWARLPGQVIRRLALLSGGDGKLDDTSLDALDAARPYNISVYVDQQTTARQLVQQIAASVNAVAGVSWTGKLFVAPVELGAADTTLAADGSALPPVKSVQQINIDAPYQKLAIGAERAWTVHALADIAFTATLTPRGAYDAATIYREGDIVTYEGSTWLFVFGDPTSGAAPPELPTTNNVYWDLLARAGGEGQDGPPGASIEAQYSADGAAWHDAPMVAGDRYIRTRVGDDGDWSIGIQIVGADGVGSTNRVSFSRFEQGQTGWSIGFNPGGIGQPLTSSVEYYGKPYLQVTFTATAAYSTDANNIVSIIERGAGKPMSAYWFTVTPGERLFIGAIVQTENCAVRATIRYWDGLGATVIRTTDAFVAPNGHTWGAHAPSGDWASDRFGGFDTVPAGAVRAELEFYALAAAAGTGDVAIADVMVAGVGPLTSDWPPFVAGPHPGRDPIVFNQDASPVGPVSGDTWYRPTFKDWYQWDGAHWNRLLGAIAALDAVSAAYIAVANLAAISATIGTLRTAASGARVEISDNLITVYDSSNVLRVRMGIW